MVEPKSHGSKAPLFFSIIGYKAVKGAGGVSEAPT
jgi:hypothetical protein